MLKSLIVITVALCFELARCANRKVSHLWSRSHAFNSQSDR